MFKRVLIVIAAVFLLFVCAALFYYFPMFLMSPADAGQIPNSNIYVIRDFGNNVYLINTGIGYIMIDAGLNIRNIENFLREAGIHTNDVKWIFLTHSDGDHLASLPLFPNANIYLSKDELPLLNGAVKRNIFGGTSLPLGVNIDRIIPLTNGDEFIFNETKIKSIAAPGHTPGSMLYLVDDKYLFTGDAFKIRNGNISVHPYSMDVSFSRKTIENLREIISNSKIILTSHYGIHYNY